ncbi:S26 family signal peptidase [Thiothrix lacustris]|uniref:S26 family signal peptidase n=1 Tax=Thiothrix lacustris TaxID=525917 RepID=UPI0027E40443|nr:S26 family signal peptidase [Thiothrix lacustris]WMP17320.1 S26 family signal peptidase [Thiothrix lacustris]
MATPERLEKARRLRNYLLLSLGVGVVWGTALLWVIAHYRLAGNETNSLPDRFFIIEQGLHPVLRDELLAFHVGAGVRHYPSGMVWVKSVVGLPGDSIEWHADVVTVAGKVVGKAKAVNRFGETLTRTPAGIIPAGHYFVATPHPDSYDSRYSDIGLIGDAQIAGRVVW